MPNRLTYEIKGDFAPEARNGLNIGPFNANFNPASKTFTSLVQSIGVVEEALQIGDVTSPGLIVIKNLDLTNYVDIGLTSSYCIRLKPGRIAAFPPVGTIQAIANSSACDVQVMVFPDSE